jgi:cytochrome P450
MWQAWRDPLGIWTDRHFRDLHLFGKGPLGAVIVVNDPAGIRYVLTDNASNYEKGALQRRVLGPLLADGLLLTEGDVWRRARRIMAPLFTPARTAPMAARMYEVCARRVSSWGLDQGDRILNVDSEMSGLTFDILSATLFSDQLDGDAAGFEAALNRYLGVAARISPLDVMGAPNWIPRPGRVVAGDTGRFFERRVAALVSARRHQLEACEIESSASGPDDLLTALLRARDETNGQDKGPPALSDREVAANILTFILAGHETTARTLGWVLHLVSRSPEVADRLRIEASALDLSRLDWAEQLPWTRAVIEEAMRLFPPAPTLARRALGADTICGQAIEAGTAVIISPWVLHRHEKLWVDPEAFWPERFLPENRKTVDRYAYIPFSAGPRVCIGAAFAMQEAMIALATILGSAQVEAVSTAEPWPLQQVTLRSRKPIKLKFRNGRSKSS